MKKSFLIILVFCLLLSLNCNVYATSSVETENIAKSYVLEKIESFYGYPECKWNENTYIDSTIVLYSPKEDICGYIFSLKNDTVNTGYVQVAVTNKSFQIINFGFDGSSLLEQSIFHYNSDPNNQKV